MVRGADRALHLEPTPILGFIWHLFDQLGTGASLIILLSCFSFVLGSYLILRVFCPVRLSFALLVGLALFPPVFSQIATINKESLSSHLLLAAFGIGLSAGRGTAKRASALALALAAVAVLIRYQNVLVAAVLACAFLVPAPTAGWLQVLATAARRGTWMGLVFVAAMAGFVAVIDRTADVNWAEPFKANQRNQAIFELAGAVSRSKPADLPLLRASGIDATRIIAMIDRDYTSRTNTTLYDLGDALEPAETGVLKAQIASLLVDHPSAVSDHRRAAFAQLIGLGDVCWPVQMQIIRPIQPGQDMRWASVVGLSELRSSLASWALGARWFPANTLLFRPVIYVGICAACLAWMLSSSARRRRYGQVAALPVSGILYCASFYPITPSCDFRYLYWTVICAALGAAVILGQEVSLRLHRTAA